MSTSGDSIATCAACGAPFVCGARAGSRACWCADLPPLEPVPGHGCLCRDCLERALAESANGSA